MECLMYSVLELQKLAINEMNALLKILLVLAIILGTLMLIGCTDGDEVVKGPTPYQIPDVFYFPRDLNIPADNPITEEGVLLGRYLFYDGRFSGRDHPDSLMSCSSCHVQSSGFDTGFDHPFFTNGRPVGLGGNPTAHYTLPLVNLVYNHNGYFWNGFIHRSNPGYGSQILNVPDDPEFHKKNLESIVWMTVVDPTEVNGSIDRTVDMISNIPTYPPMFKDAFGTEDVTMERISKAIAQFVRTIISHNSKYHKYIEGEEELTESETRGLELFFSEEADCFHCHGGFLMSTYEYFNNAKDSVFTDPFDRFSVSGDVMETGSYRAPPLINCEVTGPYMHDGRFNTLREVVDFYSDGLVNSPYAHPLMKYTSTNGVQLSEQQKDDLIAFLKTLTDHELISDPKYSKPSDLNP